jgi:hypothetical protein
MCLEDPADGRLAKDQTEIVEFGTILLLRKFSVAEEAS